MCLESPFSTVFSTVGYVRDYFRPLRMGIYLKVYTQPEWARIVFSPQNGPKWNLRLDRAKSCARFSREKNPKYWRVGFLFAKIVYHSRR